MRRSKFAALVAAAAAIGLGAVAVALLLGPGIAGDAGRAADTARAAEKPRLPFSKRLAESGVKSCLDRFDALGAGVMGGAEKYFPASNWSLAAPDEHLASVFLGQQFANPKLPFGFAGLFASPDRRGDCDGVSVQVLPSPLDCATLQQQLLKRGKLIGDLAGVALIQDVASQVALVPTSANICVMVSIRSVYAAKS